MRRRRFRARARRGGFSLVEMVVAMTMLSVVLMSLAKVVTIVAVRARTNELAAQRTAVLQSELNKFVSMPYDTLAAFSTATRTLTASGFSYKRRLTRTAATNRYTVKIVILPVSDTTRKDSVTFDRVKTATSALCTSC